MKPLEICNALGMAGAYEGFPKFDGSFLHREEDGSIKAYIDRAYNGSEPWEVATGFDPDVLQKIQKIYAGDISGLTDEEKTIILNRVNDPIRLQRQDRYTAESDPIFFMWQRAKMNPTTGVIYDEQDWKDKVTEIDTELPYKTEVVVDL